MSMKMILTELENLLAKVEKYIKDLETVPEKETAVERHTRENEMYSLIITKYKIMKLMTEVRDIIHSGNLLKNLLININKKRE